jgi:hypothetical protein
MRERN